MTHHQSKDLHKPFGRLAELPRAKFVNWATPIERQQRLSEHLGIELLVKRDDLTGLAFGGNKVRQLEYYFGRAQSENADAILITGAIQSNYVRVAAACAARLGMMCYIQLENRVPNMDETYQTSGNVLLDQLLGAEIQYYSVGEDEEGADQQLHDIAEHLKRRGHRPYVIPLGSGHAPTGALGYISCAQEALSQQYFEHVVTASGSGLTQAGFLFGLRALRWNGPVQGICIRRAAALQHSRIFGHCEKIAGMLGVENPVASSDVVVRDDVLAPGYGVMNEAVVEAIRTCARLDGLILDPVYTGRTMAGLFQCVRDGTIPKGSRVLFIHTGGLPAVFGYATELQRHGLTTTASGFQNISNETGH